MCFVWSCAACEIRTLTPATLALLTAQRAFISLAWVYLQRRPFPRVSLPVIMRGCRVHTLGACSLAPDLLIQFYVAHIYGERVKKQKCG